MIEYEVREGVGWIVFNRPEKLNAINLEGWRRLVDIVNEAGMDGSVKAVIVTGKGKAFCAGDDIGMMYETVGAEENIELFHVFWRAVNGLLELEKPVVAAVNGIAYGGGLELTLLCDYVIASEEARFALPEIKIGAYPPIASVLLPFFVGFRRAQELMFTGRPVDAREALEMGLVNRVVPGEGLLREAEETAKSLALLPQPSIRLIKRSLTRLAYILGSGSFRRCSHCSPRPIAIGVALRAL